jgi:predicted nucleic acid-binding protein
LTLVVDASVVIAALLDDGDTGRWAEDILLSDHLATPHLMPVEAANIIRRASLFGDVSSDNASIAHAELQALPVDLCPYGAIASRA